MQQSLFVNNLASHGAVSDVDVLIQTFNEEENLPHTLASLKGWVRNVFIVDSGSTDRTIEIAREYARRWCSTPGKATPLRKIGRWIICRFSPTGF